MSPACSYCGLQSGVPSKVDSIPGRHLRLGLVVRSGYQRPVLNVLAGYSEYSPCAHGRPAYIMAPASRVLGDLRSPGRCIAAASTRAAARGFMPPAWRTRSGSESVAGRTCSRHAKSRVHWHTGHQWTCAQTVGTVRWTPARLPGSRQLMMRGGAAGSWCDDLVRRAHWQACSLKCNLLLNE